jgi:hypothetical protein
MAIKLMSEEPIVIKDIDGRLAYRPSHHAQETLDNLRSICTGHTHNESSTCLIAQSADAIEELIKELDDLHKVTYIYYLHCSNLDRFDDIESLCSPCSSYEDIIYNEYDEDSSRQQPIVSYAAMWGKNGLIWHYQIGGLPYRKTGWALTAKRAEAKAKQFFPKDLFSHD